MEKLSLTNKEFFLNIDLDAFILVLNLVSNNIKNQVVYIQCLYSVFTLN
jgi:hypothetical protein